ncbi:C2 domain-containing protein [Auriculariales sp. MPI-PUGE-AT-0066]|nr:C2 domain-containing protein [Auriculariales sp. MPI-PUGE-AT-0066]
MSTSSPTLSKRPSFRGRFGGSRKPTSVEPQPGEKPIAVLRVQVIGCKELPAADMNGKSDPYVVLIFARQRQKTPVISKTLTPVYDPKTATFDFPMYASVLEKVGSLVEVVVWDKDVIGKDYLGELALPACDWFKYNGGAKGFNSPTNKAYDFWLPLVSSRSKRDAKGQIHLKLGFTVAPGTTAPDFDLVYTEHVTGGRGARNIMSVPPTEGFGTLGEHAAVDAGNESDDDDDMDHSPRHRRTSTLGSLPTFRLNWSGTRIDYSFGAHQDVEGIVLLEVRSAANLPKLTGGVSKLVGGSWDMDPFVVINFNRKTFRTRVVRHSLEPEWNEKIMFHVQFVAETPLQLTVLDWDKVQSNDHVGDATIDLAELMARAPKPDAKTGLFAADEDLAHGLKDLVLPLTVSKDVKTDGVKPSIYVRIKYDPHAFLRQRFWRATLHTSDTDKNGCWSRTELSAFLDKNGLSLAPEAVSKFFEDRNKDEITMDEAVESLEQAIGMRAAPAIEPEAAPEVEAVEPPGPATSEPEAEPVVEAPAPAEPECQPVEPIVEPPAPVAAEPKPEPQVEPIDTSPSTPPDSEFVIVPKEEEAVSEPEELEVPAPQPEAPICEPAPPAIEPEAPPPVEVATPAPLPPVDVVLPTPAPAPEPPVEVATPAPPPPVDVVPPAPAPAPEPVPEPKPRESTKSKPKPKATGVELSPAQSDLATSYAALILADAEIDVSGANILALASAAGIALEPFWAEIFARGLEGRDVKSNLLNVGAGSGAPAVSAAPAMGGAVVCEAQPEEIKDEEKAESDSDVSQIRPVPLVLLPDYCAGRIWWPV